MLFSSTLIHSVMWVYRKSKYSIFYIYQKQVYNRVVFIKYWKVSRINANRPTQNYKFLSLKQTTVEEENHVLVSI